MKKLGFFAVLVSLVGLSVQAEDHRRSGFCDNDYTRAEAYRVLHRAENSASDTQGNLGLVIEAYRKHQLCLRDTTDSFVQIQRAMGGANKTAEARTGFRTLLRFLAFENQIQDLTRGLVNLARAENSAEDAVGNFEMVATAISRHQSRTPIRRATHLFNQILEAEGGNNKTGEARSAFRLLARNFQRYPFRRLARLYIRVRNVENSGQDAIGNFELVLGAARKGHSLREATDTFVEILRESGPNKTSEARSAFRAIYDL